jgi:hypothetical protein
MSIQVPLNERAREALRLYKVLSGAKTYSEAVVSLMEEAGHEVPEGELTGDERLEMVFGSGD